MKTKLITLDGVQLVCRDGYNPPHELLADFDNCCGAGEGLGEKLVPDKIMGVKISAACNIHDDCFEMGDATWADFHQSNSMFIRNIINILRVKSKWRILGFFRVLMAATFFYAVDTIGAAIYKKLKESQGLNIN